MKWSGRFEGYHASAFRKDLISGLIVGVIAIPLGMAFAIASGVKPEYGIYTTIVAGILISLLGGSKFQIGGPTGAFIPILFAIVLQYGYENLLIAGLMAGIFLVLMGLFKLGALIKFIPRPVTIGFTTGIAVIIFSGQIASFLGLQGVERHEDFIANMAEIGKHLSTLNSYSIITAVISLTVILVAPKFLPKVPGALLGLIVSSLVAAFFFKGDVATIGSAYGAIPNTLPQFQLPAITWDRIVTLIQPALIIAMLGGIESLLSAVVADGMTGTKHNSNRELIGQGIANIVTPLFGGIPATGAIARTATNIKSGAASPMSGIVHGVVVLLVLLLFAPYASHIPLAGMAPVLMIVAWNMSERKAFMQVLRTKTSDSLVLVVTFLLTVFTNLTTAVEVGLILAFILFVKRMSQSLTIAKMLPDRGHDDGKVTAQAVTESHDCPQVNIYTVDGSLFFGAATSFERSMEEAIQKQPRVILLRMGQVPFMDTTGEAHLSSLVKHASKYGAIVLLTEVQEQPLAMMKKNNIDKLISPEHIFARTGDAISYALTHLDQKKCIGCSHFAFRECSALSSGQQSPCSKPAEPHKQKTLVAL